MNDQEVIEFLRDVLRAKDELIAELRKQIPSPSFQFNQQCFHEYTFGAPNPRTCKKCGLFEPYTITLTTGSGITEIK